MSKLPPLKRLVLEDFPSDIQQWMPKLIEPLNQFMAAVSGGLDRKLTLTDNCVAQFKTVTLSITNSSGGGTIQGSGTAGMLPKFTDATTLGDSGQSIDANGRLSLSKGIAFPGGSTLDAAPTVPVASTVTPVVDGTAAPGTDTGFARGDHVHPTDTSRVQAGKCNTWPASTAASVNLTYASDCNAAPAGWSYYNTGTLNTPSQYGILHTVSTGGEYATPNAGSIWIQQEACTTDGAQPWVRHNINNGGWSAWTQLGTGTGSKGNGTATIGAASTSVTVTNAAVTASSVIQLTPQGSLTLAGSLWVVPAAGSFTVRCDAAPGGSGLVVGFSIMS